MKVDPGKSRRGQLAIRLTLALLYTAVGIVLIGVTYGFASIMSPQDARQRFWQLIGQRLFLSPTIIVTATGLACLARAVHCLFHNPAKVHSESESKSVRPAVWLLLCIIVVILLASL